MASGRENANTALQVVGTALGPVGSILSAVAGGFLMKPKTVPYEFATDPKQLSKGDQIIYSYDKATLGREIESLKKVAEDVPRVEQARLDSEKRKAEAEIEAKAKAAQAEIDRVAGEKLPQVTDARRIAGADFRGGIIGTNVQVSTAQQVAQSLPSIFAPTKAANTTHVIPYYTGPLAQSQPYVSEGTGSKRVDQKKIAIYVIGGALVLSMILTMRKGRK